MVDYKKAYNKYHKQPKYKKDRAARNKARRKALKEGKVKKGGSFDVHHKDKNPNNNSPKNIAVVHRSVNRGKLRKRRRSYLA
jgi:U3 small nucleolar RNA-associated protein 14